MSAQAELDAANAILAPQKIVLGLTLRPYTAGTEAQLEQVRLVLKRKLAGLLAETEEKERQMLAGTYLIAAFLWLHSADRKETERACWDADLLMAGLRSFMDRFSTPQLWGACEQVEAIREEARKQDNYTVESNEPTLPN